MTTDTWPVLSPLALRRFWIALGLAALLAFGLTQPLRWSPVCTLYPPWSLEWIIFGCFIGAPDPPPDLNAG